MNTPSPSQDRDDEAALKALRKRLKDAGLRSTAPRQAVLGLLEHAERPLSHGDVVEALGETRWDQATLYRNLIKLVEVGLARVATVSHGVTRYEVTPTEEEAHAHAHFICKDCGTVQCLPELDMALDAKRGMEPWLRDADLQLVGHCLDCRIAG